MFITRKGKRRNHGRYPICSTESVCHAGIAWTPLPGSSEKPKTVATIKVSLENDLERSGGGEHTHFVHIGIDDFFQMAKTLSDKASDNELLQQEIARCFGGKMNFSEKARLATMALQLLTAFTKK